MEIQPDFSELLELLIAREAKFVIVGAHAMAHYGVPRNTGDIDILISPAAENVDQVFAALDEFGFGDVGFSKSDLMNPNKVVQLGFPPVRIDFMSEITGVKWDEVWAGKEAGKYGDLSVFYIGKAQFIANKRATGRPKDLGDIDVVGKLR